MNRTPNHARASSGEEVAAQLPPPSPSSLYESATRAGLIFFRWDPGARRIHMEGAITQVLGYTAHEFAEDPDLFMRIVTPEGGGDVRELIRRLKESTAPKEELRVRAKARDGRIVFLDIALVPILGEGGRLVGWEGFARDVTAIAGIERLAAEGFERFQTLFDSAPLAMVLYDPKTLTIEQANARAAHLYGVTREEMEGSFVSEYVAPDEWPRVQELVRRSPEESSKVAILQRVLHRRADGTVFPVQTAAVTVPIGGRPSRLVIVRDLADVEASEERIRVVYRTLEASPNATVLLDRSWAVAFANGAAATLLGRSRDDLKGRVFTSLLEPRHAAEFQSARATIAPGKDWDRFVSLVHSSGKAVRAHATLSAVPDTDDAPVRCIATLRPLHRAGPQGELTSEELAVFFDLLAHDVVNYLTAVRGYIELISTDQELSDRNRRMADIARSQSDNALDLIHDTRRVVGLERENTRDPVKGDLVKILNDAVVRVEPILKSRKFKVRRDFTAPSATIASPDVIREVFVNLLHNAVKYDSNEEVVLDLVIERSGEGDAQMWRVRVGDRGAGIPDEEKPYVFERGFRRQATRANLDRAIAPKGSGIGLSICKFLIERLGGSIKVESRIPGDWRQGTNFIVELPAE